MNKSSSIISKECVQCVICVRKLDHGFLRCIESIFDINSNSYQKYTSNKSSHIDCNRSTGNNSKSNVNNSTSRKLGDFCKSSTSQTSTHMTHMTQACLLKQQLPLPSFSIGNRGFVCFDFEWAPYPDVNGQQRFRASSFVDSKGVKKVLLIEDYEKQFGGKAECALLTEIVNYLSKYDYCFGWYSSGVEVYDDLKHRYKRQEF